MNQQMNRTLNMGVRAHGYATANPLTPVNAAATALTTSIASRIAQMNTEGAGQSGGRSERFAGAAERRALSKALRETLGQLVKAAKAMDLASTPEAAEVRMPRGSSYQALRDTAQAVSAIVTANKAAFVAMDWPSTVDVDFAAMVEQFDTSLNRKNHGSQVAITSTAALEETAKALVKDVRKLDAILSKRWKDNAGLLAGWKSASHIERTVPKRKTATARAASAEGATTASAATATGGESSGGEPSGATAPAQTEAPQPA